MSLCPEKLERTCKVLVKESPSTLAEDRQAFIVSAYSKDTQLPQYFDRENWETFHQCEARVSHIYDLSKFWIVIKEQEVNYLQNYLYDYYTKYGEFYVIPENKRKIFLYCVGCYDGVYYRGIIVNICHTLRNYKTQALLFCIDFGFIVPVEIEHLYMFTKKLYSVPHFAVRACLSDLAPVNGISWRVEDYQKFFNLVNDQVLFCKVEWVDKKRKVLGVRLAQWDNVLKQQYSISEALLDEQAAVKLTISDLTSREFSEKQVDEKDQNTIKLPFLLPSFEALEWGIAPSSIIAHNTLKNC